MTHDAVAHFVRLLHGHEHNQDYDENGCNHPLPYNAHFRTLAFGVQSAIEPLELPRTVGYGWLLSNLESRIW